LEEKRECTENQEKESVCQKMSSSGNLRKMSPARKIKERKDQRISTIREPAPNASTIWGNRSLKVSKSACFRQLPILTHTSLPVAPGEVAKK